MSKYKSLEEINTDFQGRIDATDDADTKAVLIEQRAEARADFKVAQATAKAKEESDARELQVRARERQAWIREALVEFPLAQQMPELIGGDTEEAVKSSAKTAHERIEKIQQAAVAAVPAPAPNANEPVPQQQIQQAAQQAYGQPVGGGNPPPEVSEREKKMQDYASKYNGDRSGQFWGERRNINPAETDEYVRLRGGPHMLERMLASAEQKYGAGSPIVEAMKHQITVPGR